MKFYLIMFFFWKKKRNEKITTGIVSCQTLNVDFYHYIFKIIELIFASLAVII